MSTRARLQRLESSSRHDERARLARFVHSAMKRLAADPEAFLLLQRVAERVAELGAFDADADDGAVTRALETDPVAAALARQLPAWLWTPCPDFGAQP